MPFSLTELPVQERKLQDSENELEIRMKSIQARSEQLLSQVSWARRSALICASPLAASSWGTVQKGSARASAAIPLTAKTWSQVRAGLSIAGVCCGNLSSGFAQCFEGQRAALRGVIKQTPTPWC